MNSSEMYELVSSWLIQLRCSVLEEACEAVCYRCHWARIGEKENGGIVFKAVKYGNMWRHTVSTDGIYECDAGNIRDLLNK